MRKCIRTAAALLLALALAAGLFGCSKLTPIVSGGDKPHTTEPAATGIANGRQRHAEHGKCRRHR